MDDQTSFPPLPDPLPHSHRVNTERSKESARDGYRGEGTERTVGCTHTWTVIRYSNDDVLMDLEAVFQDVLNRLGVACDG
jgi:very-short-patch-repair endonuclease